MATKRFKKGKWQYRVSRKGVIDQPIYMTFDDEKMGDFWAADIEAKLDQGIVPEEIKKRSAISRLKKNALLREVIEAAIENGEVSVSDEKILAVLAKRYPTTLLSSMDFHWAEAWIQDLKRVEYRSPTTIRHHVGALARCLDSLEKRGDIVKNPLRMLPRGYSSYSRADMAALPKGKAARVDQARDRRLDPKEEDSILKVLDGKTSKEGKAGKLFLPSQAALELLMVWALESAMRLQEIYTLDKHQVDIKRKTFFLDKTKNGDRRQVPMTSVAIDAYKVYREHVKAGTRGMAGVSFGPDLIFPFWDGEDSLESRNRATAKLSAQFARIFDAAGCPDLRFHDLRHEATSRFFERSTLSDTEIAKITGHRSPAMLMRYANLRGSVLAGRLW